MNMLLSAMEGLPGKRVPAVKVPAQSTTVRTRHVGRDTIATLRTLVGGEVTEYMLLLPESRNANVPD